jgi:hypothetical protein
MDSCLFCTDRGTGRVFPSANPYNNEELLSGNDGKGRELFVTGFLFLKILLKMVPPVILPAGWRLGFVPRILRIKALLFQVFWIQINPQSPIFDQKSSLSYPLG